MVISDSGGGGVVLLLLLSHAQRAVGVVFADEGLRSACLGAVTHMVRDGGGDGD